MISDSTFCQFLPYLPAETWFLPAKSTLCQFLPCVWQKQVSAGKKPTLLYTDDLILMSTTASGLQNHINNLYKFCAAWHLIVSLPKTKVLIFNDSHKAEKYIFNFGKETIDIVSEYKYLGIIFTSNSRNVFDQTVIEKQQRPCTKCAVT